MTTVHALERQLEAIVARDNRKQRMEARQGEQGRGRGECDLRDGLSGMGASTLADHQSTIVER